MLTVTERIAAAAAEIGPAEGPLAVAELLVAVAHDTRDRGVWSGNRMLTYWDRLPDQVRAACYGGPTVGHWWERMCRILGSGQPTNAPDRVALGQALTTADGAAVLSVLRSQTEMVCLRVRLVYQLTRPQTETTETTEQTEAML